MTWACGYGQVVKPDPLVISWQGRQVRVRHDDPRVGPYTPRGAVIRCAMELASDVDGLQLVLMTALGDRYRVRVSDDGSVVGLWREGVTHEKRPAPRGTGLAGSRGGPMPATQRMAAPPRVVRR